MIKKGPHKGFRGFTLIEMIIAIGIFSTMMVVAIGMFTKLNSTQRLNQTKLDLLNEVRFSLDLMGTEILFGYAFPPTPVSFPGGCSAGCSPTQSTDKFIFGTKIRSDIPARLIEYYLDTATGRIMRGEEKFFGVCSITPFPTADCYAPLTSGKIKITQLTFTVANKGADLQPIVIVTVNGAVQGEKFQLSSTYSPRFSQDPSAVPPTDNQLPTISITSPPPPSFTTTSASINISGRASDNVGVVSVTWFNQETGGTGSALATTPGYQDWRASNISLQPGNNTIVFTAADAAGNTATARIDIFSNRPPSVPSVSTNPHCSSSTGAAHIRIDVSDVSASIYEIQYLSSGSWINIYSGSGTSFDDTSLAFGESRSYRARACAGSLCSSYSAAVTDTAPTSCTIAPPPPPPDCPSTTLCSGGSVDGNIGDVICGSGSNELTCTSSGWTSTGSCTCPPPPPPPPPPPGTFSIEVSGTPVMRVYVSGVGSSSEDSTKIKIIVIDDGYGGSVNFSCGGPPPGGICRFNPSSSGSPGSTQLYITVPNNVISGPNGYFEDFPITVLGSGGGDTSSASAVLRVIIGDTNQN